MRGRWEGEKREIAGHRGVKERIEQTLQEMQRAEREGNLEKASQLKYGVLPSLRKQVEEASRAAEGSKDRLLKEEVDEEDVARYRLPVDGDPRIPAGRGGGAEALEMEERLSARVVGQEEAVGLVANAVRRARSGLKDPRRPIGSFLFLGPTGVGKTELARALAQFLFDDEAAMGASTCPSTWRSIRSRG